MNPPKQQDIACFELGEFIEGQINHCFAGSRVSNDGQLAIMQEQQAGRVCRPSPKPVSIVLREKHPDVKHVPLDSRSEVRRYVVGGADPEYENIGTRIHIFTYAVARM